MIVWETDAERALSELVLSVQDRETAGVLLGVPALGAAEARVRRVLPLRVAPARGRRAVLTWRSWQHAQDESGADEVIGWYSSRPRHGVHPTEADRFVHTMFFPETDGLGLIFDVPAHTCGRIGRRDGEVALLRELPLPGRRRWPRRAAGQLSRALTAA